MTFVGTRHVEGCTEYNVWSDLYQVGRWVTANHVRPNWQRWGSKWRKLEQLRKPAPQVAGARGKAVQVKAISPRATVSPKALTSIFAPTVRVSTAETSPSPLGISDTSGSISTGNAVGQTSTETAGNTAPTVHLPIPQPPMTSATLERCMTVLQNMMEREEAVWFAQPVCLPMRMAAGGFSEHMHMRTINF